MTHDNAYQQLRESLAALSHEQWSGWMDYMLGKCTRTSTGAILIPAGYVAALERQMETPYAELSPDEQASDLAEADRVLALVAAASVQRGGVRLRECDLAEVVADAAAQRIRVLGACPLCGAPLDSQAAVTHAPGCPLEAYMLAR